VGINLTCLARRLIWRIGARTGCDRYARGEQLLVGAGLAQDPLVKHQDLIHILNGRESMGNCNRRASRHQREQRIANQELGLGVYAGGRLVEDEEARIEGERPSERQQLLLPDRQRGAALGDVRLIAARQSLDERIRVNGGGGALDIGVDKSWRPSRMLSATVPENRCTSCSTRLKSERISPRSNSRMSTPSIVMRPRCTS